MTSTSIAVRLLLLLLLCATLPLLAQALARGELSYAKVRALTRVATPETEARLLGVGRGGTAAHVERIVRGWRCIDRKTEARETKRQHASRAATGSEKRWARRGSWARSGSVAQSSSSNRSRTAIEVEVN